MGNDNSQYLITSRLIAQKHAASWYRKMFVELMSLRHSHQRRGEYGTTEPLLKKGNTEYLVGTMAAINDKNVKLVFNDNADKLLYHSFDNMSNDLLVIDRNTMTTLNVTCKGSPSWIFKDYLIVSQLGGNRNHKKFTTLDIQGFISETSIAEVLCDEIEVDGDYIYDSFPWYLCLEIATFVGSSREFRDITLINYKLKYDDTNNRFIDNILLETKQCDNVWNVGNYVVIMIKNEIIFYDSRCIDFKDEDTLTAYSDGHGIIARNNKKNMRTFRKLWIDQTKM